MRTALGAGGGKLPGMSAWVGRTATEICEAVLAGKVKAREVAAEHLDRIERLDGELNAFVRVRRDAALAEADAVDSRIGRGERTDRADRDGDDGNASGGGSGGGNGNGGGLALAGVPVPIKDNVPVAGEPMRQGSSATPDTPQEADHPVVARLRAAGAVLVGLTTLPEFGLYGVSDSAFGITRTPWDTGRSAGGSSGGAAAAVASAMVPVAHGNDGLGSIRIPAANCGLFGFRPGPGVVPADVGIGWAGMAENGPLATTVADAALLLSVMAEDPDGPLRLAVSTKPTAPGALIRSEFKTAVRETGKLLAGAGHMVAPASPRYPLWSGPATLGRWFGAGLPDVAPYDMAAMEKRTRRHLRAGRILAPLQRRPNERTRDRLREVFTPFFDRYDALIMPTLAQPAPRAVRWGERGLAGNFLANVRYAPMTGIWNMAGYPAAAVPAGVGSTGLPLSVQLVTSPGREALLLAIAGQLERLRPWRRHAPGYDPAAAPT
jgi:amidase